jgi:DNA polymerase IV
VAGRVVTLKLRKTDFKIITRRRALAVPTQTAKILFATARELLVKEADGGPWRLIGVGLAELIDADTVEHDFFAGAEQKALVEERAVDKLRARFGPDVVQSGRSLGVKRTSDD